MPEQSQNNQHEILDYRNNVRELMTFKESLMSHYLYDLPSAIQTGHTGDPWQTIKDWVAMGEHEQALSENFDELKACYDHAIKILLKVNVYNRLPSHHFSTMIMIAAFHHHDQMLEALLKQDQDKQRMNAHALGDKTALDCVDSYTRTAFILRQYGAKTAKELHESTVQQAQDEDIIIKSIKPKQALSSRLSRFVDFVNRQLFAALFDISMHRRVAPLDLKTRTIYGSSLMLRALLLPLTSTIYVMSRLGLVVLNPKAYQHNPAKAYIMLGATLLAGLITVGLALSTSLFTAQTFMTVSGAMGSAFAGGVIVAAVAMIAVASLLHLAKTVAQGINTKKYYYTLGINDLSPINVTAPKHHIQEEPWMHSAQELGDMALHTFQTYHKAVLTSYYMAKSPSYFHPSQEAQLVKPILTQFETLGKAHKRAEVTTEMLSNLKQDFDKIKNSNSKGMQGISGQFWFAAKGLSEATVVNGRLKLTA